MLRHRSLNLKKLFVHGVLAFAMPAGTPRQQARNCGLKQRVSLDLEQGGSLDLEQRVSPDLKQRVSLDLEQRVSPDIEQRVLSILNSGVLLVNRPPTFFQNSCLQRAADGS
jgi:hypothetical protein